MPSCVQAADLVRLSPAIQAPLKLKAPRGAPTPINRNQANVPRGGSSLLGKRPFDSVGTPPSPCNMSAFVHFPPGIRKEQSVVRNEMSILTLTPEVEG